jgi:hypothetical protein
MVIHKALPIPEPEGTDPKEVFAFFGLCAYYGQVLERGLVNLATILHARGLTRVTRQDVLDAFDREERKTMGTLIKDLKSKVTVPSSLEAKLKAAVSDRNYLAHRFFVVHDVDILSSPGRRDMIAELRDMATRFQWADSDLESITLPLWERLGLTQERLEEELASMNAEANARETSS